MLQGKNVLITGASEGIGAALAARLQARGARLALVSRRSPTIAADLTLAADRVRAVGEACELLGGPIDILVNNAGIGLYAPSWQADPLDLRHMFELNLFAAMDLARLVVPGMVERRSGLIVNIGSVAGQVTLPWFTGYSASKAALGSYTAGLRMELAGTGVSAMLVCPGYVQTGFQDHVLGGKPPRRIREVKRFAVTPDQCAAAIVNGMERGARTVVTPWSGWLFAAAGRLLPGVVEARLARWNQGR